MDDTDCPASDHDDEEEQPSQNVVKITDKRRQQKDAFEEYIRANITNDDFFRPSAKNSRDDNDAHRDPPEFICASASNSQETKAASKVIIGNPRDYQLELFEKAKHENLIAVLDTGSGKTLIAVLLLKWVIDQELEARAKGKPPRISLFIVASVNLVIQQAEVLKSNLSHPIAQLYGSVNINRQSKDIWQNLFREHKIIVCTADILTDCLSRGLLKMDQISLLIFDEGHHAKKDHAFARIMQEFYPKLDHASRPRIFSMTASPIDTKTDVAREASRLEKLLDSKIVTAGQMSELQHLHRAKDQFLGYDPNDSPISGSILATIRQHFRKLDKLMEVADTARQIAMHLGSWCGDRYLLELTDETKRNRFSLELRAEIAKKDASLTTQQLDSVSKQYEKALDFLREAEKQTKKVPDLTALSPKVLELLKYLREHFMNNRESRCLVFVQVRATARLLKLIFDAIQLINLRADYLIGAEKNHVLDVGLTVKQQSDILQRFHRGETNCLFVTSVAEEGLDIPQCNLVIRFDLYTTMIQCIQSRGRARRENSLFVHMFENGNSVHRGLIQGVREQEMKMRLWCTQLPSERKLLFEDDYHENDDKYKDQKRIYKDPDSGAILNFGNAMIYLANMVSLMPSTSEGYKHPIYVISPKGMKYVAEVLLPSGSPLTSVIGTVCTKKGLARRSAAFEACLQMRKRDYLDQHFVPTYVKKLPAMRNALLAVNAKALSAYPMMTKPTVWKQELILPAAELWLTLLEFRGEACAEYHPLVMATKTKMPHFPDIKLFDTFGAVYEATFTSTQCALTVSLDDLELLSVCTHQIFIDIFSKNYENDMKKRPYFLAPAKTSLTRPSSRELIDWTLTAKIAESEPETWNETWRNEDLIDKLLVDPWSDVRKLVVTGIHPSLRPFDPVPADVVKTKHMQSILDYSSSIRNPIQRAETRFSPSQPVLTAQRLDLRRNVLVKPTKKESEFNALIYVCPEPFKVSPIPPFMGRSCLAWPAIISRLEAVLISLEACSKLEIVCKPHLALAAVTKTTADDESSEKVDHGMGENYERLEFLGDCFLKMATSLGVFVNHPTNDEFEYHVKRMLMLCNQNLFNVSRKLDLAPYVRSKGFSRRLWYPEGIELLTGGGAGQDQTTVYNTQTQQLSEKTIADVSEALIGAAFVSHNIPDHWKPELWSDVVTAVTKLVGSDDHNMLVWQDYQDAHKIPAYQIKEASASQQDMAAQIEKVHPYHFKSATLLRSAFIHPSYPYLWESIPSYQRLEFLGDSLLDLAIITFLFYKYPDKDEQWMTEAKMVIVSNRFLGFLACHLGFHNHLRHCDAALQAQITAYAATVKEARSTDDGSNIYWTTISADPPKCLADIVEAYVAAMFIDSGFDYGQVQIFFNQHIKLYFDDMTLFSSYVKTDPVTAFHNMLHRKYGCSGGRTLNRELPAVSNAERKQLILAVMVHANVIAHSTGASTRYASGRAAKAAFDVLQDIEVEEFRKRYDCDCKS